MISDPADQCPSTTLTPDGQTVRCQLPKDPQHTLHSATAPTGHFLAWTSRPPAPVSKP